MDFVKLIEQRASENHELYKRYMNPSFARVMQIIDYNRIYTKGEGAYLYDQDGNRYLDFLGGYGVFHLGRNHPRMKQALHQLLDLDRPNLIQMDCPLLAGLLAEALVQQAQASYPGLEAVVFTNSGAESVEGALKFARGATGRSRFLYLDHAYHGLTLGALSVNGGKFFRSGFSDLLPATVAPMNDLQALEQELEKGDVAAFIAEPIQGKGVYVPDDDFLPGAQRLCRKHEAIFIVDEIQTGLGRTGRFFCGEHWNLEPDITTVSKALSGGFIPVGAVLMRREIHRKVYSNLERSVVHMSTFAMNDMAMGAGLATLSVLREDDLAANAARLGEYFIAGLRELQEKYEMVKDVRGKGLMVGIEFGPPTSLKLKPGWTALEKAQTGLFAQVVVMNLMREHRLLTQVSAHRVNIVKFLPPLNISEQQIDDALTAMDQTLAVAHRFPGGLWKMGADLVKGALRS